MYPDNYDAIFNKFEQLGFESLSEKEKVVFCVGQLEAEINNGGFNQFFWNSSGDFFQETVSALEKINAQKTKKIVTDAGALLGSDVLKNQIARQGILEEKEAEIEDNFDELDRQFYKYEDPITSLVNSYLEK